MDLVPEEAIEAPLISWRGLSRLDCTLCGPVVTVERPLTDCEMVQLTEEHAEAHRQARSWVR